MEELGRVLGLTWGRVQRKTLIIDTKAGPTPTDVCYVYSLDGPPYLELIERREGTVFEDVGMHHLGLWCDDPAAESVRLEKEGWPRESVNLTPEGNWAGALYHLGTAGLRVEVVDIAKSGPTTLPLPRRRRLHVSDGTTTMLEHFVDNDGVRIRYLEWAPFDAAGAPIVFVPGFVDVADDYHEAFVDVDRRVLVIELRGRGRSDAPPTGYSAEAQVTDIHAVVEAAGIDRFHLMTFSRGTTPGLLYALGTDHELLSVSIGDYLAAEIGLPEEFADRMWQGRWRGTPNSERVERHALFGIQQESRSRDLWDDLAGLDVPVLVARGGDGSFVDDDVAERYRKAVPDIEIVDIPGSGHDVFRPSRTAYPEAVRDFIARRAPGS